MYNVLSLLALFVTLNATAEIVKRREVEIGTPSAGYVDPEIEEASLQISFINKVDGGLYLSKLDPATGLLIDHNYQYIDKPTSIAKTLNGPEWGYSINGPSIYYTKPDAQGKDHNFRYRDGKIDQLDSGDFSLIANYCSKNETDAATWVMGAKLDASLVETKLLNWGIFREDAPNNIQLFQMASVGKGPRFVKGVRQVTTNLYDSKGVIQGYVYDIDSKKHIQITRDGGRKNSLVAFNAPELGGEQLFAANVLSEDLGEDTLKRSQELAAKLGDSRVKDGLAFVGMLAQSIRVYRKVNNSWLPYKEIRPENGKLLMNAQAFSYKGKTFFSMDQYTVKSLVTNHSIVIQDMAGKFNITVSGPSEMVRFDPEVLVLGDKIIVYYYDLVSGRFFLSEVQIPNALL
jgi:hypothetical protein